MSTKKFSNDVVKTDDLCTTDFYRGLSSFVCLHDEKDNLKAFTFNTLLGLSQLNKDEVTRRRKENKLDKDRNYEAETTGNGRKNE